METADAALITNIAEDHLGDFGSQSLRELLNIKWVISHAVEQAGTLVLNADDELLVDKAASFDGRIVWFSLDGLVEAGTEERLAGELSTGETVYVCAACAEQAGM